MFAAWKFNETWMDHTVRDLLTYSTCVMFACGFLIQILNMLLLSYALQSVLCVLFFSTLTLLLLIIYLGFRYDHSIITCIVSYLFSTFTLLITWRISVLLQMHWVSPFFCTAVLLKVFSYCLFAWSDLRKLKAEGSTRAHPHNTRFEWQLFFLRIVIGFVFVPHFTEKLFAGPLIRADDIVAFQTLGFSPAVWYVYLAGLIELAISFSIGCGFLTRLGAIIGAIYLLTATYFGHHFNIGFIWASKGGGWEYPVIWTTCILSFACFGADRFSFDQMLKTRYHCPRWIQYLMG